VAGVGPPRSSLQAGHMNAGMTGAAELESQLQQTIIQVVEFSSSSSSSHSM